jgi:hypothetical protein
VSNESQAGESFAVAHNPPFQKAPAPAGVVAVDATQHVRVVSAEPAFREQLELAVKMLNSSETLLINAMPPAEEESRRQYRRIVERNEAGAREALLKILRDRYDFELTPLPGR